MGAPGPWSRPPFLLGNDAALKHGATSPERVKPIAAALAAEVVTLAPWAARSTFAATVASWSWTEAQCHLIRAYLDEHGLLDSDGVPLPANGLLSRLETRAANLRGELGLSPLSLARLLATFATAVAGGADDDGALDRLKAEGAAILAARSLELVQPDDQAELDQGDGDEGDELT